MPPVVRTYDGDRMCGNERRAIRELLWRWSFIYFWSQVEIVSLLIWQDDATYIHHVMLQGLKRLEEGYLR